MDDYAADILLAVLRDSYRLRLGTSTVTDADGEELVQIDASDDLGQSWIIRHATLGGAALELAERLGFEVEDS